MKKLIALLMTMLMVFALVGCGSAEKKEATEGDDNLKVILLIPGHLGDKSFFDAANAGLTKVKNELNVTTKVVEMGTDATKWEPTFLEASEGDWDIIISGNDTTELMNNIAEQFPDKRYMNFDTFMEETPDNVYAMFYSTNELSFLAGALAGLVTKSNMEKANAENVIGFLGGMDIPGINDFLVGYIQGAQHVNPDIKILISYAGIFTDPAKGKEIGLVQYQSGIDVCFAAAGGTGLGLIEAAAEKGKYVIGVDSDQAMLFKDTDPKKAEALITSAVKNIDLAIFNAVKAHLDGTIEYGTYNKLGIKEQGVGLADNEYYKNVPQEIRDEVQALAEQVANGEIKVVSAFGMEQEELDRMRDQVKP